VAAADFFAGMLLTARQPDELVEEVHFPLRDPSARYGFQEVAMRHGDFAIVALAAVVTADRGRLAAGGVADRPLMTTLTRESLEHGLNEFAWRLDAQDDHHATAAYRRHLVRTLGRQLLS
jgi:2-furoyl-CoA dehydrogenase FAD binding subunit